MRDIDSLRSKHCHGESIISQTGGVESIVGARSNNASIES